MIVRWNSSRTFYISWYLDRFLNLHRPSCFRSFGWSSLDPTGWWVISTGGIYTSINFCCAQLNSINSTSSPWSYSHLNKASPKLCYYAIEMISRYSTVTRRPAKESKAKPKQWLNTIAHENILYPTLSSALFIASEPFSVEKCFSCIYRRKHVCYGSIKESEHPSMLLGSEFYDKTMVHTKMSTRKEQ